MFPKYKYDMSYSLFTFHFLLLGKPAADDVKLNALTIKEGMKIMMMGSQEEKLVSLIHY